MNNIVHLQQENGNGGGGLVEVESKRAIAEAQSQFAIAKRFPRDERRAIDRIDTACQRPGLAEQATYLYSRGGTNVEGASIRLAETIALAWGNIDFGFRELEQANGESTVQAFAVDLETNTRRTASFVVRHERHVTDRRNPRGPKIVQPLTDPRDVYELVANNAARRVRACVLSVVPGDVTEAAVQRCKATLEITEKVTPERLAALVHRFGELGVTKEQIEKRIQRKLEAITPAQLVQFRSIGVSIRDGMSQAADWFDAAAVVETEKKKGVEVAKAAAKAATQPEPVKETPERKAVLDQCALAIAEKVGRDAVEAYLVNSGAFSPAEVATLIGDWFKS